MRKEDDQARETRKTVTAEYTEGTDKVGVFAVLYRPIREISVIPAVAGKIRFFGGFRLWTKRQTIWTKSYRRGLDPVLELKQKNHGGRGKIIPMSRSFGTDREKLTT